MNRQELIAFYQESITNNLLKSSTDFGGFLELLKTKHRDLLQPQKDFEQSWRGVKGAAFEVLVEYILEQHLRQHDMYLLQGRKLPKREDAVLWELTRQLLVDYKANGKHLPDIDLIVYRRNPLRPVAILSLKTSLRERIAQVAYWSGKVRIPYFFVTTDNDEDFTRSQSNKPRAIAEQDTHGVYLITEQPIVETEKVKQFNRLIADLLTL